MAAWRPYLTLLFFAPIALLVEYAEAAEKNKPSLKETIEKHNKFFQSVGKIDEPLKDDDPRVRIGLRLTPFQSVKQDGAGKKVASSVAGATMRYTLRAKLTKPNHFYFNKFHVQTVPFSWRKESKVYQVKLVINQRFDPGVEESLGTMEVRGTLTGTSDILTLEGMSSQTFRDKWGEPVLSVVAGFPGPKESAEIRVAKPTSP
ncbi:MAG: hypothetical protein HYW48_04370 [Deltaproteobacteria bacterium]|nr:hypothetical protein [Deltaproteobacteria bacterium]